MKKLLLTFGIVAALWTIALYNNTLEVKEKVSAEVNEQSTNQVEELPKIGFKAPSFELVALDGKKYSIESIKGKPVVINFWASWCGPCRLEAPELVELYKQYGNDIEIYAVNLTSSDSESDAQAFADEFGFKFPILLDKNGSVATDYRIQAIPTTYFVNQEGIIMDRVLGLANSETLEIKFKNLMSASGK